MKLKSRPVQSVLFLCCYVLEFGVFKRRPALPERCSLHLLMKAAF